MAGIQSGGLNFGNVAKTMSSTLDKADKKLQDALSAAGTGPDGELSQTQLLKVQRAMQNQMTLTNMQATIVKALADSCNTVIQKAG